MAGKLTRIAIKGEKRHERQENDDRPGLEAGEG